MLGLGAVTVFCTSGWEVCVCVSVCGQVFQRVKETVYHCTKTAHFFYWLAGVVRCCQHALFSHSTRVHRNYTNCYHFDISNQPFIIYLFIESYIWVDCQIDLTLFSKRKLQKWCNNCKFFHSVKCKRSVRACIEEIRDWCEILVG
jgi:hypothetical protein